MRGAVLSAARLAPVASCYAVQGCLPVQCLVLSLEMLTLCTLKPYRYAMYGMLLLFAALVNCCTIDWFDPWPAEALKVPTNATVLICTHAHVPDCATAITV
jgi:P-loop containing dynein motor region D4